MTWTWMFTRGTIKAHAVKDSVTACKRKDLKFEPSHGGVILEKYKCKTCLKRIVKEGSGIK